MEIDMRRTSKTTIIALRAASRSVGLGICVVLLSACSAGGLDPNDPEYSEPSDPESEYAEAIEGSVEQAIRVSAGAMEGFAVDVPFSNMCLDVSGNNWTNGTNIQQWDCNRTQAQQFYRVACRPGIAVRDCFFIVHGPSKKCVDVSGASQENGANVQLWSCNDTLAQKFWVEEGVYGQLWKNMASFKCLDIANWSKSRGGNVHQWDCGMWQANQNFRSRADFNEQPVVVW
jgi:hypothetical protein